ncbi:MAG TPA: hypothetical protein VI322_01130 [Candidatus Saccharimonadia bacterium]
MAYEDIWEDDPMPEFSDDMGYGYDGTYYDEDRGFYEFNERIDQPDDAELDAEAMAADEPVETNNLANAGPGNADKVDAAFHETLTDNTVADQIEDESLHAEAKKDYPDIEEAA